jgi:hypothetical protein
VKPANQLSHAVVASAMAQRSFSDCATERQFIPSMELRHLVICPYI